MKDGVNIKVIALSDTTLLLLQLTILVLEQILGMTTKFMWKKLTHLHTWLFSWWLKNYNH